MKPGFSVCVLIYGDYLALSRRCLDSVFAGLNHKRVIDVRVGLNEASDRVRDYVLGKLQHEHTSVPKFVYEPTDRENVLKYPLMRRMFYDDKRPIEASHIMWFDDDSCLVGLPGLRLSWWGKVWEAVQFAHMVGDLWSLHFQGKVKEGIQAQPWYTGKPWLDLNGKDIMRFATGGWWAAQTEIIQKHNYPWPELEHNGGDCTLGELLRQQGLTLHRFRDGLWINADAKGKQSGAKRRGATQRPLWYDYRPDQQPDFSHHEFDLTVHEF
jgi:hypothetical protein